MKPAARLEKNFVDNILIPQLKLIPNSWWLKVPTVSIRGIPDIIGCICGRFVVLECKRDGARPDPSREKLQVYVCEQIRQSGGVAFERVDESNYKEVLKHLMGEFFHGSK